MIYYACDIPEDLYYDIERDVWIRFDGDLAVLGMTDVAQTRCGKFAAISFRDVGKKVAQGKTLATIESAKWVGPFPAPFSCEIVEVNEAMKAKPSLINSDPYGEGWFVKIKPADWAGESATLVTGDAAVAAYQKFMEEQNISFG